MDDIAGRYTKKELEQKLQARIDEVSNLLVVVNKPTTDQDTEELHRYADDMVRTAQLIADLVALIAPKDQQ